MPGTIDLQQRFAHATVQPWGKLLPWQKLAQTLQLYARKEQITHSVDNWNLAEDSYLTLTSTPISFEGLLRGFTRIREAQPEGGVIAITLDFAAQKGIRWLNAARARPLAPALFQTAANISRHIVFGQIDTDAFMRDLAVNWTVERNPGPQTWVHFEDPIWTEKNKNGENLGPIDLAMMPVEKLIRPELFPWDLHGEVPSDIPKAPVETLLQEFETSF